MKEEKINQEKLLCPKAGTATSSPASKAPSQSNMNIVNVMLWMKKNAYEDSTIKKVSKLLRHLKRNCNTADPEAVKLFVANKTCENGYKENLIEAYNLRMRSEGLTWDKPFYQRYDKKRKAPPEKVWEMLALDRLPKWADYPRMPVKYTSEVQTPKDKYRVGATAQGIPKKPNDEYCRYEILESLEHEKIKYREWENSKFGRLSMLATYTLEPVETNTKLTCETETEKFWGIFGKFLEKVYYRRWAEKQIQKALEKMKNILEK